MKGGKCHTLCVLDCFAASPFFVGAQTGKAECGLMAHTFFQSLLSHISAPTMERSQADVILKR